MKGLRVFLLVILMLCSLAAPCFADNGDVTVYITKTGECYHKEGCSYLRNSKIAITLLEAVEANYRACSRCKPPTLDAGSSARSAPTETSPVRASVAEPCPSYVAQPPTSTPVTVKEAAQEKSVPTWVVIVASLFGLAFLLSAGSVFLFVLTDSVETFRNWLRRRR